jgi:hypothetical protein
VNQLRKRPLDEHSSRGQRSDPDEIDISACATVAYSSEVPAHPVEHLFDTSQGRGGTRWLSGRADFPEQLQIEFDQPQSIRRLLFEAEERGRARTQEVRVEVSTDGGNTYRQILVQEYTFSPEGATFQREDLRFELDGVTHLWLTIVPNKNGSGMASLTSLRLFR